MNAVWQDSRVAPGIRAQLERRRQLLAAGERPIGWKLAFGAPAALEHLGLPAPVTGFLLESARLPSGGTCPLTGWVKPSLEAEIAIHLGRDVLAGASAETARAAIGSLGAALEIADFDRPPDELEAVVATNIYHRHVVLGPDQSERAGGDLSGVSVRVRRNGEEVSVTDTPTALTGELVELVRDVADLLDAFGEQLKAGEVIISGSVIPILEVSAGQTVEADFGPLGRLSITFTE